MKSLGALKVILLEQEKCCKALVDLLQKERAYLIDFEVGGIEELTKGKDTLLSAAAPPRGGAAPPDRVCSPRVPAAHPPTSRSGASPTARATPSSRESASSSFRSPRASRT